jgi:hypothetical protein
MYIPATLFTTNKYGFATLKAVITLFSLTLYSFSSSVACSAAVTCM